MKRRGIFFIEVLVATAVVSTAGFQVFGLFSVGVQGAARARSSQLASLVMGHVVDTLAARGHASLLPLAGQEHTERWGPHGAFASSDPLLAIRARVDEVGAGLIRIAVSAATLDGRSTWVTMRYVADPALGRVSR